MATDNIKNYLDGFLDALKAKQKTDKENGVKWQSTEHQHLAIETAKGFGDMKSLGIYMQIYKRHFLNKHKLLKCKEWVMSRQDCTDKGRLFVAIYKKFLNNF